jgi:hypothetical protein
VLVVGLLVSYAADTSTGVSPKGSGQMQSFSSRTDLYNLAREEGSSTAEGAATSATFYLTLCQVVAPVSVPESKSPALQRFRFFFERRFEAGRTGYWLQFGYFASELEAQRWRDVLARIYPRATIQRLSTGKSTSATATQPALTETQVLRILKASVPTENAPKTSAAPKGKSAGLENSLQALRDTEWEGLKEDDTTIRSGIRHLQVELVAGARLRKERKPTRRS